MSDNPAAALVIAAHGRLALIETADGRRVKCQMRGRKLEIVCGDRVLWEASPTTNDGVITDRLPRSSVLLRTDSVGRAETVMANITQLLVVLAVKPEPDFFMVDRYLAAAEVVGIEAGLIVNKADLMPEATEECRRELQVFAQLGYPLFECSAKTGQNLEAVKTELNGEISALVGQSGVGKSSLANRLLPGLDADTMELSRGTHEGKHTTTASTLHHLPSGGDLIDTPGVRDFAPAIEMLGDPARGFREITALAPQCKFNDCRHLREPSCAVRAAVDAGTVSARRYESYRRLRRLSEELAPPPGFKPKRY